ncbi:hypothetical protein GNP81_07910 [Aliivibrio fischeri]|uniref:hypothetical protein n=1 Tax=Aliivibrio fischeri TaxID=668 RepID=UPI0012D925F8|nr:hypothetical protein [Aliivibrio fischeri]MUK60736.1 hypothetical protein [Aliivibrio fischeri]MUL20758.1 hypothetical protein [Aliivibrio fischeri]MUL24533.1 hypothetical protein [Aliivibrio fischeri]
MSKDVKQQSNPFSTGGGGVNFETRVQAAFALSLLTKSCVPCLSQHMKAKELKFQNKYDGVNTDDFVLVATDKASNQSQLFAQIKHEITVSESVDSMFAEVVNSAWKDFKNTGFNIESDSIALITGPLPKLDVNNTLPILEWAKYSSNSADFIKKSKTKGFTSKEKVKKLNIFRAQLTNANEGNAITDDELWHFLKAFQIISLDLDAKFSVVANLLCSLIECYSDESPSLVLSKLVTCVQEFNQNAGVLTKDNAPEEVKFLFESSSKVSFENDLLKLQERGAHIFEGISNTINGFHVDRAEQLAKISELYGANDFLFVTGARGVGKSGVVKDFISTKGKDVPVFYLRAEDLDKSHLNDVFTSIGMNSTLGQIEGHFSLLKEKILVIESLEKVLELNYQDAFVDLLQYIKRQVGWTIIATGRDYAYQQLVFNYLQPSAIQFDSVNIEGLSKDQVSQVCEHSPELTGLISNDSLADLLKVPFFIEIAVRAIGNGAQFKSGDTEVDFRNTVWATVISKEADRKSGMPDKRRTTFINIAKQRAKKMLFGIRASEFDPEVVAKLEEDHLIHRDQRSATISPMHDVLEDWALEEYIESEYVENSHDLINFLLTIGNEPAISRAFRLWLYRKLKSDDATNEFVEELLTTDGIKSYWKDEAIAAIMQHDSPESFLYSLKSQLLKDDCALLIRFCFILRITCQRPSSLYNDLLIEDEKSGMLKYLFLQPYGNGWEALFNFIYEVKHDLNNSMHTQAVEVINEWCGLINIYDDLPKASEKVGLLSLWLLEQVKDSYRDEGRRKKILNVLLKVSTAIKEKFDELMDQDVFISKIKPRRLSYVDELTSLALVGTNVPMLCKRNPDFVVKLSLHEWLLQKPEEDEFGYSSYGRIDVEESYGLDRERDFFPASGSKGPFKYLLESKPRLALDFIIKLCNLTAQKYAESEFGVASSDEQEKYFSDEVAAKQVDVILNDGTLIKQYASPHLWKGYRGQSTLPCLLQCALMALENWLVEYVDTCSEDNEIEWIYDYLLRKSNSVMLTSVLSSVATGFPNKVGKAAFPLLKTADLYHLDLIRMTQERGGNELHVFNHQRDVMTKIYIEERRKAALRPWRKESLETLLTRLQFVSELRDSALKIVDELTGEATARNEKNLRYMVHRVDTRTWEAVEDKDNDQILLQSSSELPADLKQDQQEFNEKHAIDNTVISLNLWGQKLFEEKLLEEKYFSSYQDALIAAKELLNSLQKGEIHNFADMVVGTITIVAAVCVRDDLLNLSDGDKEWCLGVILESIFMHADNMNGTTAHDKTDYYGSGACAFVLPKLFDLELDSEQEDHLKFALATALTHENLNVSAYAAKGVREFLWSRDVELASSCIAGIVEYARLRREDSVVRRFYHLQGDELQAAIEKWNALITTFRNELVDGKFKLSVNDISLESHCSWFLHLPMLMVPYCTTDDVQIQLVNRLVNFVFDTEYQNHRSSGDEKINYDIKKQMRDCLSEHVIYSRNNNFMPFKELLVLGCSKAPSFIYSITLSYNVVVEKEDDYYAVWSLWSLLAPEAHKIAMNDVNDRYVGLQNDLNQLLRGLMYADSPWQGHPNEERDMKAGAHYLLEFANQSAGNSHVFEALTSLIYHFHSVFFDKGIHLLASKFTVNSELIGKQINTAYYLEMSIGRYLQIENRGALNRKMYNSCLELLNGIVETGSARAYYLREHMIRSRKIRV